MSFSGGDPGELAERSRALRRVAADVGAAVGEVSSVGRAAGGAVGSVELAAAIDRFVAAWGGELLSDGLAIGHFGSIAAVTGDQVTAATGSR